MYNSYQRCGNACVRPHGSLRCSALLQCLVLSSEFAAICLLESLAMLASAVLAYRLACSACQPADPLVLHALPFNLHAHQWAKLVGHN